MNRHHHNATTSISRTRSRQPAQSIKPTNPHNPIIITRNDAPASSSSPFSLTTTATTTSPVNGQCLALVPGPYTPPPSLAQLLINPKITLHPEDEPDHILAITTAILLRKNNRAMSVKELGEAAYVLGYLRTSPSAAGQAIGTHIRNHTARHVDSPSNALLSSYRLVGGVEDIRLADALYCSAPGTCRKGTTVWYLSTATGVPCPFEALQRGEGSSTTTTSPTPATTAITGATATGTGTPLVNGLKRKIPPDDTAEFQRPNKIRITLRLPPRTPIPPRPRPIIPTTTTMTDSYSTSSTSSSSSDDSSDSDSNSDASNNGASDSDEAMLDDFSSLLATPHPIPRRRGRGRGRLGGGISAGGLSVGIGIGGGGGGGANFCQSTLSHPFFDTCEPPPDSEDDDDDFHNSMLKPDVDVDVDELGLGLEDVVKEEEEGEGEGLDHLVDFDIKEEDLVAILSAHSAHTSPVPVPPPATSGGGSSIDHGHGQHQPQPQGQNDVIEDEDADADANSNRLPMALKLEEGEGVGVGVGVFSPMMESDLETTMSSPTPFLLPQYQQAAPRRASSSIHSVPPPTPWIKAEDENFMFERHFSPDDRLLHEHDNDDDDDVLREDHDQRLLHDDDHDLLLHDDHLSVAADLDLGAGVDSPLLSALAISSVRPWENLNLNLNLNHNHSRLEDWTSVSQMVPGPESVSTDDVDFDLVADDLDGDGQRIKTSSSAPVFPFTPTASTATTTATASASGRKPLRLSIGNNTTTSFSSSSGMAGAGHARRHSHAAVLTNQQQRLNSNRNRDRRLSIISNTATAFSDWTSGTPEDPDAPLVTPSHTGWRTYQCWPVVVKNESSSSTTLAHERIEEREGGEDEEGKGGRGGRLSGTEQSATSQTPVVIPPEQHAAKNEEELNRVLMAPSFNQVLTKSLPPHHRISTLLLLGIPVFQCRLDTPPMELIRRIDTDYVNISSIITYAKYLAQAAPTSRSRAHTNPSNLKPPLPPPPSADELPPNHVFITSGARHIHGGWVPLSTARALVKNYHDLPPFIRRVFLSDSLAEKFPPPISYVRSLLIACRDKDKVSAGPHPAFGKPFAKPHSLSARELLVGSSAASSVGALASNTIISDAKGPVTARGGVQLALNMCGAGFVPTSYPLSPVAALSSANALRANKAAQHASAASANSMQSLMALTTSPLSSSLNGWSIGLVGKTPVERHEAPLQPEEEEMLNAILKTPPKARTDVKQGTAAAAAVRSALEEDEGMSVDEKEEEEVAREVVDIGSDEEEEEEELDDDTVKLGRNVPAKKTKPTLAPRRSLRRMRSISSISSELTVSESESSAPPPSLDSRPALKGKSTNQPASPTLAALATVNGRRKRGDAASASIPLPARSDLDTVKKVKIIEMDEPADIGKPRRSIRTAKSDPTPAPAPRASKTSQAASSSDAKPSGSEKAAALAAAKPRRSTVVEKEVEKDGPVLTRAGAAAAQKNAKRTLRSRA